MYRIEGRYVTIKQNGSERMAEQAAEDMAAGTDSTARVWVLVGGDTSQSWLLLHTYNPEVIQ